MQIIFRNLVRAVSFPRYTKFRPIRLPLRAIYTSEPKFTRSEYRLGSQKLNESRSVEIADFLKRHRLEFREKDSEYIIKYCPFCTRPHGEKLDNLHKLNLNRNSGCFFCFRCSSKGSWYDFKRHWDANGGMRQRGEGGNEGSTSIESLSEMVESTALGITMDKAKIKAAADKHTALLEGKHPNVISYLTGKDYEKGERGLKLETLVHYKVGLGVEEFRNDENMYSVYESVYFPMYSVRGDHKPNDNEGEDVRLSRELMETSAHVLKRLKVRAIGKANKHRQRVAPAGKLWYFASERVAGSLASTLCRKTRSPW